MTSTSDRRWMYNTNINVHSNPDYVNNLERFLDFAYSNPEVVENKLTISGHIVLNIKCPCKVCNNKPYR